MTLVGLRKRLRYWQGVLRLQDWDININFGNIGDFRSQDTIGSVMFYEDSKTADVLILHPDFMPSGGEDQIETTIIHELLHIRIGEFAKETDEVAEEQFVNQMSKTLAGMVPKSEKKVN